MSKTHCTLTVFFEDPFWVGVYERREENRYSACRIVFGAEPKDQEVSVLLTEQFHRLHFSPSLSATCAEEKHLSPKRMQRAVKKQLQRTGTGTKAQEALKLPHEEGKEKRKKRSRLQKEAEQERQFELRRQKQKAGHKGR